MERRPVTLIFKVGIRPHPSSPGTIVELACVVPIDVFSLWLGHPVEVPHAGWASRAGSPVRRIGSDLAGLGYPDRQGQTGPLHVHFETVTPRQWTAEQRSG